MQKSFIGGKKVKELENFVIGKRDLTKSKDKRTSKRTSFLKYFSFGNGLTKEENAIVKQMANKLADETIQKSGITPIEQSYDLASKAVKKNSIMNFVRNRSNSFTNNLRTLSTSSSRTSSKDSRESNSRF